MYLAAPPKDPFQAITRTANPVRRAFHLLVAILGWVAFFLFLYRVFFRPIDPGTFPTFLLLAAVALAIAVVDLLWIRFNLHLHRTRPRRTRVTQREYTATKDLLGRPLEGAEWTRLRAATRIRIDLTNEGRGKRYLTSDRESPESRGSGPIEEEGERSWSG
jgi:hypothetical protein